MHGVQAMLAGYQRSHVPFVRRLGDELSGGWRSFEAVWLGERVDVDRVRDATSSPLSSPLE